MKRRDMTEAQFSAALERHGIGPRAGFLGYHSIELDAATSLHVPAANGGSTRRAQLAYLIARKREAQQRHDLDARTRAAMLALIEDASDVDPRWVASTGDGTITLHKLERLTVEHAAAIVLLLRELRANT